MIINVFLAWEMYLFHFLIYDNNFWNCTCVSIHNTSAYEVLSEHKMSYTWEPYLFSHNCKHFSITYLTDIFVFGNAYKFQVIFRNILYLGATLVLLHQWSLKYSLFATHICFANAYKILCNSQIFYILYIFNILYLATIFVLSHLWSLKYSLFGSIFHFKKAY